MKPDYLFPHPPAPGALITVAEGVHWLRMPLPFALDHINLWLLRDGDGWTIVDTGFNDPGTKSLWERIFSEQLQGRPVKRLIVTHMHPDHMGLSGWLCERFNLLPWMTQSEFTTAHMFWSSDPTQRLQREAIFLARHGVAAESLALMSARGSNFRQANPNIPAGLHRILADDAIDIDGRSWRVLVGYGHSPEHASLYCAELGLMIAGDMVLPRISTNISVTMIEPDGNPLRLFLDSLRKFAHLPSDTVVLPSHGLVFRGVRERIAELIKHHDERFEVLLDDCREPRLAVEVLQKLFNRQLDNHQMWFAMGEAIAHLNYLMYAGRMHRLIEKDGACRFTTA